MTNYGGSAGYYVLVLKINDIETDTIRGALDAGGMQTILFSLTDQPAGHYTVNINGITGSYEVVEPPPTTEPATTPPPTTENITQPSSVIIPTSTTIILGGPPPEADEPLSWWLITIIVVGGLLIILVTWRLIRRAG